MRLFGLEIKRAKKRELYRLADLSRIRLHPNDVIVLQMQTALDPAQADEIEENLKRTFGRDHKIVLLDKGNVLTVVGNGATSNANSDE